jgi:nucleoside-diphosphate-sugar epimerase
MRILVIGGTGTIGFHVSKQLSEAGNEVCILHRGETVRDLPPAVRTLNSCDPTPLRVREFPSEALRFSPDAVIHMIAMCDEDAKAAMNALKGHAGRMVAISSGDVYLAYARFMRLEPGEPISQPLREDSELRKSRYPYRSQDVSKDDLRWVYDKIPVEQATLSTRELPGTVLRLPKVYGPEQNCDLATVYKYRAHPHWRWTHGYVENVAAAIALAATHPNARNQIFNVGEAHTPTIEERLRLLPASTLVSHETESYDFRQDIVYSTEKIRNELGYAEIVPYEEGVRKTLAR